MPGLQIFKRKWLIACDDLVIPFAIETTFRAAWLIAASVSIWQNAQNCQNCKKAEFVQLFLYILLMDLILTTFITGAIAWISSRGYIMQTEKRKSLPKLLYLKFGTYPLDMFIACASVWLIVMFEDVYGCLIYKVDTFIQVTCFVVWFYFIQLWFGIFICYNRMGSLKFSRNIESGIYDTASLTYSWKAESMWFDRLKIIFCCLGLSKKNNAIFRGIATFLAAFFKNDELVPTDILSGLIILGKKHASERRQLKSVPSEVINKCDSFADAARPDWMTVENAAYFLRLAKSAYGWPMFFDPCNPCNLCVLTSRIRCFGSCFNRNKVIATDNCCYCNTAALQKVSGYTNDDLIYVSYHNAIYEPAFYVAFDHQKSSVVVCIRGTLSLSDIVTDIDAECASAKVENCNKEFSCHRGTLRSARFIWKKLNELKILKIAFAEHPNFVLVITGHSLGGSIGSVLGIMLHHQYPNLQCYVYAPLAVLDDSGMKLTLDTAFTVVVGDDMSPRLCPSTCENLRMEMVTGLEECTTKKYKLLYGAFSEGLDKLSPCSKCLPSAHEEADEIEKSNTTERDLNSAKSKRTYLYAPGRILFLEKTSNGCKASWVTGPYFNRIIVSLGMLVDHQPRTIQKMLETYTESNQESIAKHSEITVKSPSCHNECIV